MPDEVPTLAEVAQMLKVADKAVYTIAQRDDLDQWIEQQTLSARPREI